MGTRASDFILCIDAKPSFGLKLRLPIVEGDRIRTNISFLRHLSLDEGKKVRLRGGELMFLQIGNWV